MSITDRPDRPLHRWVWIRRYLWVVLDRARARICHALPAV